MSTVADVRTEAPRSSAESAELLAGTAGGVLVRGGGTALDWGGTVRPVDLVLDTAGLAGRVEHNPADLTVAVGAGTRLADLQDRLAAAGQWLPFDPPSGPAGATLGGVLAAGESGPSRLRHGPLRDLVIGATLVLADGTVAHSGGHVIKNVAGYDVAKLAAGSLGSLALVSELVLRVLPRSPATCTLAVRCGPRAASAAALRLFHSPAEAAALEWSGDGTGEGTLLVRVDGSPRRVAQAPDLLRRTLGDLDPGLGSLAPEEAQTAWSEHRARAAGDGLGTTAVLQGLPDRLPGLVGDVAALTGPSGRRPTVTASLALGTVLVGWPDGADGADGEDSAGLVDLLTRTRRTADAHGFTMLLRRRPAGLVVEGSVTLGPAPSTAPLLRRLKAALDPSGRFGPGRFDPWY